MTFEVLFLHTNFPAQFKHHIDFHKSRNDRITFLCLTTFGRSIPGVNTLKIKKQVPDTSEKNVLSEASKMLSTAESFYSAFKSLQQSGYKPDLVIGHSGWGCGLKLRSVWSEVFFIAYHEWWFWDIDGLVPNNVLTKTNWMPASFSKQSGALDRNSLMALELSNSNSIVSPTSWQKSLLPIQFRQNCSMCFDGIDTDFFKPNPSLKYSDDKKLLVTYGTRGMEPMRGFPDFILTVKTALQSRSDFIVKIAGNDEVCYLKSSPPHSQTWGQWAKNELKPWIDSGQVVFTGRLNRVDYLNFLQMSDIHFYLSVDFVTSWSLFESLACGCSVLSWDTISLQKDIGPPGHARHSVPCNSPKELVNGLEILLNDSNYRHQISLDARELSQKFSKLKFNQLWSDILASMTRAR